MRYVTFAAVAAMVATVAYFDWPAGALVALLFSHWWACGWVADTRHQARWRWDAARALDLTANREDPGPWVEPIPLTLANEGGY